jgi:hypothetical protein
MENESLPYPVYGTGLIIRLAHGRKSGKPSVMFICPKDGRHIRAFISDKKFVGEVLVKLQTKESSNPKAGLPLTAKPLHN